MSRNIRWRLQFKSLKGKGCLVNIYDEDYTSSADTTKTGNDVPFAVEAGVTALTGAANPFEFEEDDDESLLTVLRYKTGYMRVIEKTYGSLEALYPATNTSHYVEFFYGSTLAFTGYMQAQSFEDDWVAAPRQLDFPIMSPLGTADGAKLTVVNPPSSANLASWLAEAITGLNASYDKVIMPDVTHGLEGTISSLVVSPPNSDFTPSMAISTDAYDPITYADFIEGICNAFGWIVHDTPTALVFSMFDWGGGYCQYTLANLPTLTGKASVQPDGNRKFALDNYVEVCSDDNKVSNILPLKEIKVTYEGDFSKSESFDFNKMKYHSESHYSNNHAAWFTPVDGTISGDYLNMYGNMFNTANGHVTNTGATPALCGTANNQEFCILTKVSGSWLGSTELFKIVFYNRPQADGIMLNLTKKYGDVVSNLKSVADVTLTHYDIGVKVKVGSQYYQGQGMWASTANAFSGEEWEITNVPDGPIELTFFKTDGLSSAQADLVAISDIKLEEITSMYAEYKKYVQSEATWHKSLGSSETGEVTKLFSYERNNSNQIGTTVYNPPTLYPYLSTAQTRLQVPFRANLPANPYQPLWSYWLQGWRWRLIAQAFNPREDETTLTLHRSSSLDSIVAENSIYVHGNVSSNAPAYVHDGDYVQFSLIPDACYAIDYAVVIMGQEDITADSYSDGVVSIESVTDDVTVYVYTTAVLPDYLCFTALESGTFTLSVPAAVTSSYLSYVEYSLDGINWTRLTIDSTDQTITTPTIAAGGKVYWRGEGIKYGTYAQPSTTANSTFSSTANFDASGNIMSLLFGENFVGVTALSSSSTYAFAGLFANNKKLNSIEELSMPATTLADYCYASTFNGCSSLTGMIRELPATTIAQCAYYMTFRICSSITSTPSMTINQVEGGGYHMLYAFERCTSLIDASNIIINAAGNSSYASSFSGCSALTATPLLNVSRLVTRCFNIMFQNCSSLSYVKCLATDISVTNCTTDWLNGVSPTGTFIQAEGVTWPRGASGIPTGWVAIEKRTMPSGYKQVEYVANPNKPSSGNPVNIDNGIVLDPSQDTLEIATKPTLDSDGYIANNVNGGMLISNNTSPAQATAKIGRFYFLFAKNTSTDRIQFAWTRATATSAGLTTNSKITTIVGTPQVARVELASGDNKMYLNGTQIVTDSRTCDTSDMGTETGKLYGHSLLYNWIDPIYYYKHWRNGVLIADYVACVRESDDEPSFYDFVSNTFKVPSRTGFFTAGQEI